MGMMRTFSPVEVLSDDWWSSGCSDHTSTLRSANFLKLPNFRICARNRFTGIWWICELLALPSSGQQGVMRSYPFLSLSNGAMGAGCRWSLCVPHIKLTRAASTELHLDLQSATNAVILQQRLPNFVQVGQVFCFVYKFLTNGYERRYEDSVSYCIILYRLIVGTHALGEWSRGVVRQHPVIQAETKSRPQGSVGICRRHGRQPLSVVVVVSTPVITVLHMLHWDTLR